MPRISGVDVPDNKKIKIALRYIYGIGATSALDICEKAQIDPDKRAKDLTGAEIGKIQKVLENYLIEGDLRQYVRDNIKRYQRIKSYRGLRHSQNLPVRGQRTRSNARTKRGKRSTVGAMSKEMATKLEQAKKNKK